MPEKIKRLVEKHDQKIRFTLIGGLNTAVDFSIFLILTTCNIAPLVANVISTSCGMACSFLLNRSYVFGRSNSRISHELTKFLIITIVGLWVVQSTIIVICNQLLTGPFSLEPGIITNAIAKAIATCVSLVWNYLWYNNYVFKNNA